MIWYDIYVDISPEEKPQMLRPEDKIFENTFWGYPFWGWIEEFFNLRAVGNDWSNMIYMCIIILQIIISWGDRNSEGKMSLRHYFLGNVKDSQMKMTGELDRSTILHVSRYSGMKLIEFEEKDPWWWCIDENIVILSKY